MTDDDASLRNASGTHGEHKNRQGAAKGWRLDWSGTVNVPAGWLRCDFVLVDNAQSWLIGS